MVGTRPAKVRSDTTVGLILRQAREQRHLSLEAVSGELSIPPHHLKALEAGDLAVFAAEVYARGAFRKYTDFLGVRAETTQHAFLRTLSGAREYVPLHVYRPRPWLQSLLTPRWILAMVLAGIALSVGSYIAWQVQSFLRLPRVVITEPAGEVSQSAALTVRGMAEANARVTVNGEAVLLDDKGQFNAPLQLHPGINILQIEATNAAGRTRTVTRPLLMPRR